MIVQTIGSAENRGAGKAAIHEGLELVRTKLGDKVDALFKDVRIQLGNGLTISGGETHLEERHILLDAEKGAMSLYAVETRAVFPDTGKRCYKSGDLTRLLPGREDETWGYTVYNTVHELGHLLPPTVDANQAPTEYGREKPNEATAEAFAYYVFGMSQPVKVQQAVEQSIEKVANDSNQN